MMRSHNVFRAGVVAVTTGLVAAGAPSRAFAQPTSAIDPEVIYRSALDDMKAGRYPEACPKFAEARRLQPDSRSALQGLALCYDKSGKTASAWAKYRQLSVELKSGGDSAKAEAAAARAEELGKALSTLKVSPAGSETPGLVIRLDKEEVPRAMFGAAMNVDPGSHVLEATAPGYEVWQTTVTVGAANDAKELKVPSLVAKPSGSSSGDASGPSPALRPAAYALGGVGAAGVVLGAVFGGLAVGAASTVKSECPGNVCPSSHQSDLNAANTKALVSTVGLVAGGALLATGVVLFVVSRPSAKKDDAPAAAALVPSVGPGGGGLSMIGRF